MRDELLEQILVCPSLPSLPAVALRVIELVGKPDVVMKELASTIEQDQGLAAKVLRTVNSSFYSVRTKCSTISKALVLLGLGPVKTLSLGFSLVSAVADSGDAAFDYKAYWRRGLYSGVAAKCIAEGAGCKCSEEAFLGGLLQDVGMVAMRRALGRPYLDILAQTKGDHRKLVKLELDTFEIQHPEIGAMLAKRWKLPDELVLPVKYHERPTAAPKECTELVRCVGLGNFAHDALTDADPTDAMRKLYTRCDEWFSMKPAKVDEAMRRIGLAVREMSTLFSLDTGSSTNVDEVLARAEKQLAELAKNEPRPAAPAGSGLESLLKDSGEFDPLTGVIARKGFDGALRQAFASAAKENESTALVEVSIDGLRGVNTPEAPDAADDVVVGVATLMKKHFEPVGGLVCRLTPEIFAAVMPGSNGADALAVSEEFRAAVLRARQTWGQTAPGGASPAGNVGVSIGLSARESAGSTFDKPEQMVVAAAQAVQAARAAGGNRSNLFVPRAAA